MKTKKPSQFPFVVSLLILLLLLLGVGAVVSGTLLMIKPDGSLLQMPLNVMQDSPFSTFFIPGLILSIFLGIYPLVIAYGVWKKPGWTWLEAINAFKQYHWSWAGSLVAGFIVIIWLMVELIWVEYGFLHTTYFVWSSLIILNTLLPAVRQYFRKTP